MSVTWGLDLSTTAVRLMRRSGEVWREEGREPLEGDAMEERLKRLVERIAEPDKVNIFLPKDQVLYTTVGLADLSNARAEIEEVMNGKTPYKLDEMSLDWDIDDDSTAHVAAIAKETMEEAAVFVRGLGLRPINFSSIADVVDFPRNPNFGPLESDIAKPLILTENDVPPSPFVSARPTSEPQPAPISAEEAKKSPEPVLKVDDATPVMGVPAPAAQPLDPGLPVAQPEGPPRIRTDVGAAVARGRADSLTAPAPINVRKRDRALPTPLLAGAAAVLCLGIAAIIWSVFPNATGTLPQPPAQSDAVTEQTTGEATVPEAPQPQDTIVAAAPEPATTVEPEPELSVTPAPTLSDVSPEIVIIETAIVSPETGAQPSMPTATGSAPASTPAQPLLSLANLAPDLVPNLGNAREPRPAALAGLENTAPETLRLAALPATPESPSSTTPSLSTYPGAAITTPLADADAAVPDASLPAEVAALPPALDDADTQVIERSAVVADAAPETTTPEIAITDDTTQEGIVADATEAELPEVAETEAPIAPTEEVVATELPAETVVTEQPVTEDIAALEAPAAMTPEVLTPEVAQPSDEDSVTPPALTPTELALSVPDRAPRGRPDGFSERLERLKFGGLSIAELAQRNPPDRPSSEQVEALLALSSRAASDLAIELSPQPRSKPENFQSIVASTLVQQQTERRAAAIASNTPDTTAAIQAALAEESEAETATSPNNSPRLAIPSSASVSRQATIDDAIRLNRINLIGVYGAPSDRRALIRLSTGRYVKVKVGDRVDGGTVSAISASQLQYQKGSRTLSLNVPEG